MFNSRSELKSNIYKILFIYEKYIVIMSNNSIDRLYNGKCIGGGGYGIVIDVPSFALNEHSSSMPKALKLFRDVNSCQKLYSEVKIQNLIRELGIRTPKIIEHFSKKIFYNDIEFLCGILMEKIEPLMYGVQFHIILNPSEDDTDIDTIVYTNDSPRGFYGSAELLKAMFIDAKNGEQSDIIYFHSKYLKMGFEKYIQNIAFQMGEILQKITMAKIRPVDIEFIIDKYGDLWVIDFGLCEFIEDSNVTLETILEDTSWRGLRNDMYIPSFKNKSLRKYFMEGINYAILRHRLIS